MLAYLGAVDVGLVDSERRCEVECFLDLFRDDDLLSEQRRGWHVVIISRPFGFQMTVGEQLGHPPLVGRRDGAVQCRVPAVAYHLHLGEAVFIGVPTRRSHFVDGQSHIASLHRRGEPFYIRKRCFVDLIVEFSGQHLGAAEIFFVRYFDFEMLWKQFFPSLNRMQPYFIDGYLFSQIDDDPFYCEWRCLLVADKSCIGVVFCRRHHLLLFFAYPLCDPVVCRECACRKLSNGTPN